MKAPQYVLYINMWGAVSKLMQAAENQSDITRCQNHFLKTLRELKGSFETKVSADIAYVYSHELGPLVEFAQSYFQKIILLNGKVVLWPARAAIAKGIEFSYDSAFYIGRGNVESAWLEKSAQKGMRLFATNEVASELGDQFSIRPSRARGIEHIEINWLNLSYLSREVLKGETLGNQLSERSKQLMKIEDDYCRQVAASLTDLVSWLHKPK